MNRILFGIVLLFVCFQSVGQISLLSTDFQSGIPSNYTILNNDGNTPFSTMTPFIGQEAWISFQDPDSSLNQVAAATSYFETADSADRWLITPQITLSSFGNYIS
ncbi:MAG: choice-of-anchor J domain-containing protein, partial [Crocinitomicaceae bacterium]